MESHYEVLHDSEHPHSTRDGTIEVVECERDCTLPCSVSSVCQLAGAIDAVLDESIPTDSITTRNSLLVPTIHSGQHQDTPAMPPTPFLHSSGRSLLYEGQMKHVWAVHALHFFVLVFNFIMLMLWALNVKLLEIPAQDSGPVSSLISIILQSSFTLYVGLLFLFTQTIVNDRTIRGESSIVNMHVILQAWRGPSSAFLQLISVYIPVTRTRTPPDQAWNILFALLYLASASGIVLTTSSVLGVAVTQKLIMRPEPLGGNYMIKDDFDWNQSSNAEVIDSYDLWNNASYSMFVSSVNDTRYPGLQGSLLHDTIADNITSIDWATVSAIRLHVNCGMLDQSVSFNAWGEIHNGTHNEDGTNTVLSVIPSIHGVIGNNTGPGPDAIMMSIDLPIPPNEWSVQWSEGGPNNLHIQTQYARSPYGLGPLVNTGNLDEMAWLSRSSPLVITLPNVYHNDRLNSIDSVNSFVYPGLSQTVLGIVAPTYALNTTTLRSLNRSFEINLSKSGYPHWMWDEYGDIPNGNTQVLATLIGCSLSADHPEVNVTRDGLLLRQDFPSYGATNWTVRNTFNWSSTLPTSTIERQFSMAFQPSDLSEWTLDSYADMLPFQSPEGPLSNSLTSNMPIPISDRFISLDTLEDLLANLTASYLYSYRQLCSLEGASDCGPTANTLHRSAITVYYNGFVGNIQVSPWRAITGFVASLILFLLSLAILGVAPANNKAPSETLYGESEAKRLTEPLGTGLLDIIQLGSPSVHLALNLENRTASQEVGSSRSVANIRVRLVPGKIRDVLMLDESPESSPTYPLRQRSWDSRASIAGTSS